MIIDFNSKPERVSMEKLRSIYRNFFFSHEGKIILNDLIRSSELLMPIRSNDASNMFYTEGKRAMLYHITSHLVDEEMVQTEVQDYDPFEKA